MEQTKQQEHKINAKNKTQSEYWRRQKNELKEKIFDKLGHSCVECGYSDKRALHIDHINNNGHEHRKQNKSHIGRMRDVINDTEGQYQILCANCNFIKKHEVHEVKYMLRRAKLYGQESVKEGATRVDSPSWMGEV